MNKLLTALMTIAFAFVSATALSQAPATKQAVPTRPIPSEGDVMPLSKMTTEQAKAARAEAKAKWDAMTPEQQAAARKALRNKRQQDLTAIDEYVVKTEGTRYNAAQGAELAKESKTTPKPTRAERQEAMKAMQDASKHGQ